MADVEIDIVEGVSTETDLVEEVAQDIALKETGATGEGVPPGGDPDQVLAKASGADFDTYWKDEEGGGTVTSVFGRTGAITAATNDYEDTQIEVDDTDLSEATSLS